MASSNNFWRGQRVFVTGATGVVGAWLVKALIQRGAYVVVLIQDSDPQSELMRSGTIEKVFVANGAIEDFATLERIINLHEVEVVFHLAAQTIVGVAHRSPLPTFEANIRGSYNLLEACRVHGDLVKRIVIASSDKAYGEQDELPYREDMALAGRHPYEVSKSCTDLIAQAYHVSYDLPVGIARCGNVYGGGDLNWSRIVPGTIRSLLRGEPPVLRSDGTFVRDYIFVEDIAHAYMRLAECLDDERVKGKAFNFATDARISVFEIVDAIRALMDCQHIEPVVLDSAEGEIRNQYLSAQRARELLDWKHDYDLESGLRQTIDWYRDLLEG